MSGRVYRGTEAKRDLIKHFVYLAEQTDMETARRFRQATEEACRLLAEMPEIGPRRSFKNPRLSEVRMWPLKGFRQFLIFYKPIDGGIKLLRVIHSKEDYWRVLDS